MVTFTDFEANTHQAKFRPKLTASEGVERESELHRDIIAHCRSKRWLVISSRMDAKTTTQKGVADFVIGFGSKVVFIEAKTKTGKQRPEQLGFQMLCEMNGLEYFVVRSMDEFLKAVQAS